MSIWSNIANRFQLFAKLLLPLQKDAKAYRIHCIAHAHIDMNWMWGFQETVSVTVDTFRTVLDLMREYPDLTFAQSQASTYEIIEKYAPSMLPEIRERIREKDADLKGTMATEGTTPRQLTDLLGSLCDLTSGSGDKGTPFIYIQGYFDNYTD